MARIRNALARATHDFFQSHGFLYVHTPIVTTSDCEGAGEMFQVRGLVTREPLQYGKTVRRGGERAKCSCANHTPIDLRFFTS